MTSNEAGKREKWGILGGSFDPVHNGHLHLAISARAELGLTRVTFMPAAAPPHKLSRELVPGEDRLNMLKLATRGIADIQIDDSELARGGISYSYQTLANISESNPAVELFFVIGCDSLADLATWKRIDVIAGLVTFVVMRRSAEPVPAPSADLVKALKGRELRTVLLDAEPLPVSSTDIRERIGRGAPITGLVPAEVEEYILSRNLYR